MAHKMGILQKAQVLQENRSSIVICKSYDHAQCLRENENGGLGKLFWGFLNSD